MSGMLGVMVAPSVERLSITLSPLSPNVIGMGSGAIVVAMRGATLFYIDYTHSGVGSPSVRMQMQPVLPQTFFKRVRIETGTPNSFQDLASADATYADIGGSTCQWLWAPANLWAAADDGEVKRLIFEF
jgi:hypothetical protein